MSNPVIFLEPIFQERIWGGKRLHDAFGFTLPNEKIGECWAISAHPHGDCKVKNTIYAGKTLSNLFDSHPELFGDSLDVEFPLLVKILDAESDLSIQVHPDDTYAKENENCLHGKRECWYIIDCKPNASIVVGQNMKSANELKRAMSDGRWNDILVEIPIKPGDFFQIESGCVHALKAGTLVLEIQQSSDVTYRLYDYERTDALGAKRELHIDKALDAINYGLNGPSKSRLTVDNAHPGHFILEKNDSYTVHLIENKNDIISFPISAPYILGTVLDGSGSVEGEKIAKGDSFIVLDSPRNLQVTGNVKMICSHV